MGISGLKVLSPSVLRRLPNVLTLVRLVLILPFALTFWGQAYAWALALFVLAGVSDVVDGWLARRFGWTSRFGAIVDPIADKCLVLAALALLCWQAALPLWFFVLALARDLLIVAGAYAYHRRYGPYQMQPTWLSKANTGLLLLLVSLHLAVIAGWALAPAWLTGLLLLTTCSLFISGADYVRIWGQRSLAKQRARRAGRSV